MNLYPQSPLGMDADFAKPNAQYNSRVVMVLLGMMLFFVFYVGFVIASGYLFYLAVMNISQYGLGYNFWVMLFKIALVVGAAMLFVFTLKFLFKKHSFENPKNIELKEQEHPELFQFIRKLCEETGAPLPKRIFVNDEINAMVFYNSTILSLFMPVRKNLLIGLGLVNSVNLTEFKAIMAHEFGHFAQKSMRLGSYTYMANHIIHDMVYDRDRWDIFLDRWAQQDIRISFGAWALKGVIFVVRNILALIYRGINMLYAALSRQMEFQADLVAVSTTGSEPIITGLAKVVDGSRAMSVAQNQLSDAADHQLFTKDIFYHQTQAKAFIDSLEERSEEAPQRTDERGVTYIFNKDDHYIPSMYASHPPNYDRELNAKKEYIKGVEDERSPWELFGNAAALRAAATVKAYQFSKWGQNELTYSEPERVQAFIQSELEETVFDKKYKNAYDSRYLKGIEVDNPKKLIAKFKEEFEDDTRKAYDALYGEYLDEGLASIKKREDAVNELVGAVQGTSGKSFVYKDRKYKKDEAEHMYKELHEELDKEWEWYADFDKKVLAIHLYMAKKKKLKAEKNELLERYEFQLKLQDLRQRVHSGQQEIGEFVQDVGSRDIMEDEVYNLKNMLREMRRAFLELLDETAEIEIPTLSNMEDISTLKAFLSPEERIRAADFSGEWINEYGTQLETVASRLVRLHFKSIGNILTLQERISEAYFNEETPTE